MGVRDVDVGGGVYERHEGESVRDEGGGVVKDKECGRRVCTCVRV